MAILDPDTCENQVASSDQRWHDVRSIGRARLKYRDDVAGSLVTGGISTAYTLTTNSNFTSAAFLNGQELCFVPHVTNGAGPVTMTVDAARANIPLRSSPNQELPAGVLVQGTPYRVTYNNADGALYLQGFFGNPYNVPISAGFDYFGPTAPNSNFAFPFGQAISRTVYSSLFAGNPWSIGTTYGAGDGTTTFNLPDVRGRVTVGLDNMGGTAAESRHYRQEVASMARR